MAQTDTTTRTDAPGVMTGKPLIESDRVEGTAVYDPQGNHLGSIKRLMIEKISGKVAYAVMSFGGFLAWVRMSTPFPGASSPMTLAWVATARISPKNNYAGLQPSTGIGTTTTGQIGSANANCTTTGEPLTTGPSEVATTVVGRASGHEPEGPHHPLARHKTGVAQDARRS
jgi:PRC-barrel domain